MKITYENELRNLQSWINNANIGLISAGAVTTNMTSASNICQQINVIADGIENEYPFMQWNFGASLEIFLEISHT